MEERHWAQRLGKDRDEGEDRPIAETLPSMNIVSLAAKVRKGRSRIYWYNGAHRFVGCGTVVQYDADGFDISFITSEVDDVKQSRDHFHTDMLFRNRDGYPRPSLFCPDCDDTVERLFFWGFLWACRRCHDVVYFTQITDKNQRSYIKYIDLAASVGDEPARYERRSKFEKRHARLLELEAIWAQKEVPKLPQAVSRRLHVRYFSDEDAPGFGTEPGW